MAYISYNNIWESEFYNRVSAKDRVQGKIFNQLKLKVNDSYKKEEKLTTTFELFNDENVMNKAYQVKSFPKYRILIHIQKRIIMILNGLAINSL